MSDFIINNPLYVHLLWIVAVVGAVMAVALVYRRRAMARFATVNLHRVLAPQVSSGRRWTKVLLLAGALAAMTAALVDVRWGRSWREVPQRGVDVMFVLDVSHSMMAQDASPYRLERAKQDILDIVHEMQGDRVGLVTFAGSAAQKSPLTNNYREFQLTLDGVGPHSVSRGGSDLGQALEMAARGFIDKSANHKAIVVFSDGEDQDSKPTEVAKSLFEKRGIRIFTVGLGDDQKGARIPMRASDGRLAWLQYDGQDVWTKMNGKVLQDVALAADGAYVPAGTQHVSMDQVYKQHIASIEQQEYEQARVNAYIPRYQWFVGLALLLAGAEVLLRDVKKLRMPKSMPATAAALLALSLVAATPASSYAAGPSPSANSLPGRAAASPAASGQPQKADSATSDSSSPATQPADAQDQVEPVAPATPEAAYNQAVELYRAGKTDEAGALWSEAAQAGKPELAAKSHFNLGNCSYSAAAKLKDQQPQQAIQQLDTAIAHYRDSLKLNRADQDARVNIELAARLRQQILQQEEQKKQQEQQKQEQQQQDQQDQQQQDQQKNEQQKNDQQQQNNKQQQNQQQNQQDQQQKDQQQQSSQNQQQNQQQNQKDPQQQQDDKQSSQQDQSSPSQQNQDQKSDSKQDQNEEQKQDQKSSGQSQDEHQQDQQQSKEQEQQQDQPSSQPKQQEEQKPQDEKESASEQDQPKKVQSKQDQSQPEQNPSANEEQEKQQENKQQQQQQNAQNQPQPDEKQPGQKQSDAEPQDAKQQDQQPQNQQQQGDQPKSDRQQPPKQQPSSANNSQVPADQQHAQQGQRDEQPTDQSAEAKKQELQKQQPEIKPGQKLEANQNGAKPEAAEEVSDADLKNPKAMSKDEAAKMLQAIRDRDYLRRIQQLRKEQSQRRPVDKDW